MKTNKVKKYIMEALIDLLSEKPFMDITVTDIVKKAGVARVSYYRNFTSIDSILEYASEANADTYRKEIVNLIADDDEQRTRIILKHYYEEMFASRERLNAMREANMSMIMSRLAPKVEKLDPKKDTDIKHKYEFVAKTGMVSAISKVWLMSGMVESTDEMVDLTYNFIKKL